MSLCIHRLGSGQSQAEFQVSPVQVQSLLHIKVNAVSCGTEHTLALTEKGVSSFLI